MEILARSSYIRRKDMDSVLNCIVTDRLGPGEYGDRFIKAAKERFGFDYGLAVRSPVVALDLAITCFGLAVGDSIALSALSPSWAIKAIQTRGLQPIWLDIDAGSASLPANFTEKMAAQPVKALFLAEPWGIMPDPAMFAELGIPIIEDATYSLGASSGEIRAGSIGAIVIVGLEPSCSITAGGGALVYAPNRREGQSLRNTAERLIPEERMNDMNAALAYSQVRDIDKFLEKRRELSELYAQSLARSHRRPLSSSCESVPSCFGCVVVLESGVKDVRAYAKKKDVDTAMAFDSTCSAAGYVPEGLCPLAASLVNRSVAFPLNQRIGKTSAQKIAKVLATLP